MAVNGKQKGNSWERDIANMFSEEFEDTFRRVPNSGAIVGGLNRKLIKEGLRQDAVEILAGDIIVPKDFPFSLECKSYQDFEFHRVVQGSCKTLDGWIEQAESDANVSKKDFLLIMKFNRKGSFVCSLPHSLQSHLENYMWYKGKYLIYTLEEFLKHKYDIEVVKEWKEKLV